MMLHECWLDNINNEYLYFNGDVSIIILFYTLLLLKTLINT